MCLILFDLETDADRRLVVAANRDEFYRRETEPLHRWPDLPIIGGRDAEAGGTWMAVSAERPGRFGAVTNVRSGPPKAQPDKRSRGRLVVDFLTGADTAAQAAARLVADADQYAPVNLLVADGDEMWWATNRPVPASAIVAPGVHGLSNAALDEPWPKVVAGTQRLDALLTRGDTDVADLLTVLDDRTLAAPADLPDTGVSDELERDLSSMFVDTPDYGTRASTVLRMGSDGSGDITERRFRAGTMIGETRETW